MHRKADLTRDQATKRLRGEGVSLKYFQLHNGGTTVQLDDSHTHRFDQNLRRQKSFQLRFSPEEAQHHLLSGNGAFKTIKEGAQRFFSGASEKASPAVRRILQSADANVVQAWLFHTPLNLIINFVLLEKHPISKEV